MHFRSLLSIATLCLFLFSGKAFAQVAINNTAALPDGTAMLDISSTTDGLLIPRMTSTDRGNIAGPANGLMVYQTDGSKGIYVNNGSAATPNWQLLEVSRTPAFISNNLFFTYYFTPTYTDLGGFYIPVSYNNVSYSSNSVTLLKSGVYRITWRLAVKNGASFPLGAYSRILVNGTPQLESYIDVNGSATSTMTGDVILNLNAADVIKLQVKESAGYYLSIETYPVSGGNLTIVELK